MTNVTKVIKKIKGKNKNLLSPYVNEKKLAHNRANFFI